MKKLLHVSKHDYEGKNSPPCKRAPKWGIILASFFFSVYMSIICLKSGEPCHPNNLGIVLHQLWTVCEGILFPKCLIIHYGFFECSRWTNIIITQVYWWVFYRDTFQGQSISTAVSTQMHSGKYSPTSLFQSWSSGGGGAPWKIWTMSPNIHFILNYILDNILII